MPVESLDAVGAKIVFLADVEDVLLGDGVMWDRRCREVSDETIVHRDAIPA